MAALAPGELSRDLRRIAAALRQDARPSASHAVALRTAVAAVVALLLACALQFENPWWAGITVIGIVQSRPKATLRRGFDRALGTLVGAALGFVAAAFLYEHSVIFAIVVVSTAFSIYAQERSEHGYALLLGGVTMILVIYGSLVDPERSLDLAVFRAMEVMLGIAVTVFFEWTFAHQEPPDPPALSTKPGVWAGPVDLELLAGALSGGLAIASVPIIWNWLALPGLSQTPITAFVIMTALHDNPMFKAVSRTVGCILGGGFGLVAIGLVGDAFLPWIVLLFFGLYLTSRVKNGAADASYVGHQAGMAVILALVQGLAPSPDILPALDRLTGIFGGTLVAAAFQIGVTPLLRRALLWVDGRGRAG